MNAGRSATSEQAAPLSRNVRVLGCTSLLNDIASEMVYPLLPAFVKGVLGGSEVTLGLMEGAAETAASLLKLASGNWSDRLGVRKPLVVSGYVIAALARPLGALVTAPAQLVGLRLADRAGKGIRGAPRDALIVDSTPAGERGRAFGFQKAMDHLGAAIGPLLAAAFLWLWPGALRGLFLWTLVPGLAVVLLVVFGLREPRRKLAAQGEMETPQPGVPASAPLGRNYALYLIAVVLFTLGNSSDVFLIVRAQDLGISLTAIPLLWSLFSIVKSYGSLVAGKWIDQFGARPLLVIAWIVYAAVYLAFAFASQKWQIWGLFIAYALFFALAEPAERALVGNLAPAHRRGAAFGWFHFATGVAAFPASVVFGWLYKQYGAGVPFSLGACLAGVAAFLLLFVRLPDPALGATS
jgi:MFS family permease